MHDPARDGSHHAYNTCGDEYCGQFDPYYVYNKALFTLSSPPVEGIAWGSSNEASWTRMSIANKQGLVGRTQYGISLEGEELGSDRTMITGRKS